MKERMGCFFYTQYNLVKKVQEDLIKCGFNIKKEAKTASFLMLMVESEGFTDVYFLQSFFL